MQLRSSAPLLLVAAATLFAASTASAYTSPWGDYVAPVGPIPVSPPKCIDTPEYPCPSGGGDGGGGGSSVDPEEAARRAEAERRAAELLRQAEEEEQKEVDRVDSARDRLDTQGGNVATEAEAFRRYAEAVRKREENPQRFIAPYFRPAPPTEPVKISALAQLRCMAAGSAQALSIARQGSAAGLPTTDLSFVDANRMATEASMVVDTGRGSPGCASFQPPRRSLSSITLRSGKNAAEEAKRIARAMPVMLERLEQDARETQEIKANIVAAEKNLQQAEEALRAAELAQPPSPPPPPAPSALEPTPPPLPPPPNLLLEKLRKNKADAEEAKRKEEERLAEAAAKQKLGQGALDQELDTLREIAKATGDEQ